MEVLGSQQYSIKKPGTATITVTPKNQQGISASVTLTSKYVPVENVKPAVDPSYVLHARNANSNRQEQMEGWRITRFTEARRCHRQTHLMRIRLRL